jgi:hypothetical protein
VLINNNQFNVIKDAAKLYKESYDELFIGSKTEHVSQHN